MLNLLGRIEKGSIVNLLTRHFVIVYHKPLLSSKVVDLLSTPTAEERFTFPCETSC